MFECFGTHIKYANRRHNASGDLVICDMPFFCGLGVLVDPRLEVDDNPT